MSLNIIFMTGNNTYCSHCGSQTEEETYLESFNITHNLNRMAQAVNIYDHLWGEEAKVAEDLIKPLKQAIPLLEMVEFDKYNASNGWGTREQFLDWVIKVHLMCKQYPEARIVISK